MAQCHILMRNRKIKDIQGGKFKSNWHYLIRLCLLKWWDNLSGLSIFMSNSSSLIGISVEIIVNGIHCCLTQRSILHKAQKKPPRTLPANLFSSFHDILSGGVLGGIKRHSLISIRLLGSIFSKSTGFLRTA